MGYKVHTVDAKGGEVDLTHLRKRSAQIVIPSPGVANHVMWRAPAACHVTAVRAYTTGGTSTAVNASGAGGDFLAANLTAAAGAWASSTTVQNTTVAAGDSVTAKVTAATGTPTEVCIQVDYTIDVP